MAPVDDDTTATLIHRFYEAGIYPDWWKLEPMATRPAWANAVCRRSRRTTPIRAASSCWASTRSEAELAASFRPPREFDLVKGFAVGRTIFGDVGAGLDAGDSAPDADAVAKMAQRYARLCGLWDAARAANTECRGSTGSEEEA